ncbi:alpha/beta hydrolase fold-3 domain-containing protein [Periconia macrospinosa]|uniref:Alpha/beta hydrolase fold-3 domain-containing protein n=1 Tax=Periconia macrospinosa TaxID=97972 RepID=A0A2V1DY50_9PLEO|nr:alpha/beta hydrolase fold-3 domain-containing protein [Periconia macrospinosa]
MCDFSEYGGPSEEWLEVEKTIPENIFGITDDLAAVQKTNNDRRDKGSAEILPLFSDDLIIETYTIPTRDGSTIEGRSYRPSSKPSTEKLPVCIHYHGGGFFFGTLSSEDASCAMMAMMVDVVVFNVNYRHTPDHTFPTAWHDAQDAFAWLHANISLPTINGDPSKVVIEGVSAGAQLGASLVLEKHLGKSDVLKGLPDIAGQVLLIPALAYHGTYAEGPMKKIVSPEKSSYKQNEHAPLLPLKTAKWFIDMLKIDPLPALNDTKLNIVGATVEEVKGMPPTVIGVAGLDPLRDEGLLYAKTLAEAGVPTDVRLFKGVPHGHRRFVHLKSRVAWDDCLSQGISWVLGNPEATGKFEVKVV